MKIGYFADGPWSHQALERINLKNQFEIVFIVPRYETQDPILKKWAEEKNIDFLVLKDVNSNDNINLLNSYDADLFVSMSFNQIIKKKLLTIAPKGFINCHAGALPFYRGRNILNWVLINDEKHFGVTIHYIDEGIDTGDIILQKKYEISDNDDYKSLLDRSYKYCAELLLESLNLINEGNLEVIKQNEINTNGSYYKKRNIGDEIINWNSSSRQIFNFIRAISHPGPCARTYINNIEYMIEKAVEQNIDNKSLENIIYHVPGTIVEVEDNQIKVKTANSFILITKFRSVEKSHYKIKINDKFSNKVEI